jgi:DNA polymerase (family 10)
MMKYGVITARRGWIEEKDVLNTLPLESFLAALRPKPGAAKPRAAKQKSA